jgi:hypothetical protein
MGQPITLAKRMILGPAATWRYYAGYAGKVAGESYPPDEDGTYKIVQYEPLGKWFPTKVQLPMGACLETYIRSSSRCLRRYLCLERLSCSCSLEDGTGHGCWQYFRPEVVREESVGFGGLRGSDQRSTIFLSLHAPKRDENPIVEIPNSLTLTRQAFHPA